MTFAWKYFVDSFLQVALFCVYSAMVSITAYTNNFVKGSINKVLNVNIALILPQTSICCVKIQWSNDNLNSKVALHQFVLYCEVFCSLFW